MTEREMIVKLVHTAIAEWEHGEVDEKIADHLLSNGVTLQRWIPVGLAGETTRGAIEFILGGSMSLDITFKQRSDIRCPHCGEIADYKIVCSATSGGRVWYDFLELIGYYVPHDLRTEENDWYGKDMVLTEEQAKSARDFVKAHRDCLYDLNDIGGLIANALLDGDDIVVNADW